MRSGRGDEEAAGRAACVLEKLQLHLHPEATRGHRAELITPGFQPGAQCGRGNTWTGRSPAVLFFCWIMLVLALAALVDAVG